MGILILKKLICNSQLILAIFCFFANDCKLNVFQTWPAPPFSSTGWRVSTCPITTRQLFTVCLKLSRFSTLKDFCNFVPPGFPRPRLRHTWNMQAGEFSSFYLFRPAPLFVTSNLLKVFSHQSSWYFGFVSRSDGWTWTAWEWPGRWRGGGCKPPSGSSASREPPRFSSSYLFSKYRHQRCM